MDSAMSSSDQATFFLNLAVIGATLFGLTLVALASFLPELMKRFERSALAAFPDRDQRRSSLSLSPPYSLSDRELLDGDPLVIFISHSIGVSWCLFCIPMAVGFSAAWMGRWSALICSLEFALFWIPLFVSFQRRQESIAKLQVYLTREERYWPAMTWILMFSLAGVAAFTLLLSLKSHVKWAGGLSSSVGIGRLGDASAFAIFKVVCVALLLLGTYTLNKEIFVYFKVITLGKVRSEWLALFLQGYENLGNDVNEVLAALPRDSDLRRELADAWNLGVPDLKSSHDAFRSDDCAKYRKLLWDELRKRISGAPEWILDVSEIATWEGNLRKTLAKCKTNLSA